MRLTCQGLYAPCFVRHSAGSFGNASGSIIQAAFIGSEYDDMVVPDASKPDFEMPDRSLPKSISAEAMEDWTKTYMSPSGRPMYIANGFGDTPGVPLKELI